MTGMRNAGQIAAVDGGTGGEIVASMDLENAGDREVVRQGLRNESTVGCSSEIAKPENIQPIDFK